jgi:hypothetical protein
MSDTAKPATMIDVMKYFGYSNASKFRAEWTNLNPQDKADLKGGLTDETLSYPDHK